MAKKNSVLIGLVGTGALLAGAGVLLTSKPTAPKPKGKLQKSLSVAEGLYTKPSQLEHQMNLTYGLYADTKQTALERQANLWSDVNALIPKQPERARIMQLKQPKVQLFSMATAADPPGWLGNLVTLGTMVRSISFQWLQWKRHFNPWIQRMHTSGNDQTTMKNWGHLLTEPPPPVDGAWHGERARQSWLNSPAVHSVPKDEYLWRKHAPFTSEAQRQQVAWNNGAYIDDHPSMGWNLSWWRARPRLLVLNNITNGSRYTDSFRKMWSLDKHPVLTGKRSSLDIGQQVKMPSWWKDRSPDGEWRYLGRVRQYYNMCYWLVWAGVIYAIESGKLIPNWYRVHCAEHGVLCPSYELEMERRKFYLTDRWGEPVTPLSIDGKRAGTYVTDADVSQMLELILKHTPIPGSLPMGTEILPDTMRRIPDWPVSQTGLFKPGFAFPSGANWNWVDLIQSRLKEQSDSSNMAQAGRIIYQIGMAIGTSIIKKATAGLASAALEYIGELGISELTDKALDYLLDAALKNAMLWCIDSATIIMEGGTIGRNDLWRGLLAVGTGATQDIIGLTMEGAIAEFQRELGGVELPDIKGGAGWQHASALLGDLQTVGGMVDDKLLGTLGGKTDGAVDKLIDKYSQGGFW